MPVYHPLTVIGHMILMLIDVNGEKRIACFINFNYWDLGLLFCLEIKMMVETILRNKGFCELLKNMKRKFPNISFSPEAKRILSQTFIINNL